MIQTNPSTLGGLLALLLWSTTFALARSLSETLGPVTAGAAVYAVGGIFCVGRLLTSRKSVGRLFGLGWKYVLGCGTLFVIYTVLIYVAVGMARNREQLLEIALLNYLWPALTILFSLLLIRSAPSLLVVPGTALALAGIFLVMTQGTEVSLTSFAGHVQSNPVAYGLALGAAVSWALYSNLARLWSKPDEDGAVELFIPTSALVLVGLRFFLPETSDWNERALIEAAVLGAITALAYALWDTAMRKGDLLLLAASAYFTPLLSTVVSCFYLRVFPGSRLWIGCALIVVGSLVSWRSSNPTRGSESKR